jgi:hypothetical protein
VISHTNFSKDISLFSVESDSFITEFTTLYSNIIGYTCTFIYPDTGITESTQFELLGIFRVFDTVE